MLKCLIACLLDSGTISQRVGEGDAQLNNITAVIGQDGGYFIGRFYIGIAYGEIGNQRLVSGLKTDAIRLIIPFLWL